MSKRVVKVGSTTLPSLARCEREAHELGAEELLLALKLHGEVVPDALAPGLTRAAYDVVDESGGAAREHRVPVPEDDAAAEAVMQRCIEGVDDAAFLDEALHHPLHAVLVGVNDGEMAELGVDVADAGNRRAVVMHAAHQQKIAGLERKIGARGEGGIDERVDVGAAKAAHGRLAGCQLGVADIELAQHVGGIARDAQHIAQGELHVERHEPASLPVGHAPAQLETQGEDGAHELGRVPGDVRHVVAVEADVEHRLVDLRQVVGQLLGGGGRAQDERLDSRKVVLEPRPGRGTQHDFPPPSRLPTGCAVSPQKWSNA